MSGGLFSGEMTGAFRAAPLALLCALLLLAAGAGAAKQGGPLDEPEFYAIELQKDPDGGKTAYLSVTATASGTLLKLESLWATQQVKLVVMPQDTNQTIQVELRKYHWEQPLRSASTAGKDHLGLTFTNQGDLFITLVSPDGPAKAYLGVIVEDGPRRDMKPVIVFRGGKQ